MPFCLGPAVQLWLSRAFKFALAGALTIAIAGSPVAFAVEVELSRSLQFQMINEETRELNGVLRAGSRVEVPDRYQVKNRSGELDPELTLNNWLKTAGRTGYGEPDRAGGLIAKTPSSLDYFYPIKIVQAAPGSTLPKYKGRTYFLALRMITRPTEGPRAGQMSTNADTRPVPSDEISAHPSASAPAAAKADRTKMEAIGVCANCGTRTEAAAFDQLVASLSPALHHASARLELTKRRTGIDLRELGSSFQQSCGFSLQSFIPVVKRQSEAAGVPPEIMLAMMVQESSGRCYSSSMNGNGTRDSGLFGVNSGTARMRRCSSAEVQTMRRMSPATLASGPRCAENPVVNLQVALKILKSKLDAITPPFVERRMRDSRGRLTADSWRMIVSAYNGGERWVLEAKRDLDRFNQIHGTKLNAYNWEDLRVFYLRAYLSSGQQERFLGSTEKGRHDRALLNLAYAENLVPRASESSGAMTAGEAFRRQLAKNP